MDYQIDSRKGKQLRIGREDETLAVFRRKNFFIHNLVGSLGGHDYEMSFPAPWTGFRYRLRQGQHAIATARRERIRQRIVEYELSVMGRAYRLLADDRHGYRYDLLEGEEARGGLTQRDFEAQAEWSGDLQVPDDWSPPIAAFVGWLVYEGQQAVSGS